MNNKFKGLYDTEGTSFISDRVEPINYYEPTIKTAKIQNHTYSINFDKTELYKEIEKLQQELQRKDNIINELMEDIPCLLEIIKRNEKDIKVYQDEWTAVRSIEYKIEEGKDE